MNVIQTFIFLGKHKVSKQLLYQSLLSAYSAVKIYGNCKLYTNERTWDILKSFDIPYTEVDTGLLDKLYLKSNSFAIPKLYAFADQNEPFIHIDFDTFLLKKLKIEPHNEIIYAYDDISFLKFPNGDVKGQYKSITFEDLEFFNRSYFQSVLELQEFFPEGFLKNLHLDIIPNFCIFGGYNYGLIERTVKKQIEMYRKGKHRFDEDPNMSQIIEQMSFFPHLQNLDKEFRFWQGDEFGFRGFFNRVNRLTQKYPFAIRNEDGKTKIESHGNELLVFDDMLDTINPALFENHKFSFFNKEGYNAMLKSDLGDFIHLGGVKGCEIMNRFIIDYFTINSNMDPKLIKSLQKIESSGPKEYFEKISLNEMYLYKNKADLI